MKIFHQKCIHLEKYLPVYGKRSRKNWFGDFNAGKTQLVSFDRSNNNASIDVKMDGSVIEDVNIYIYIYIYKIYIYIKCF